MPEIFITKFQGSVPLPEAVVPNLKIINFEYTKEAVCSNLNCL